MGRHAVEHICAEREAKGPFRDLRDFAQRIDPHAVNKRALETLSASGALEELGIDRATAFANVDRILALAQQAHRDKQAGQGALFGSATPAPGQGKDQARGKQDFPQAKPWVPTDRLSKEFEAVGFFLTGHPLDDYSDVLEALGADTWLEFATKARTRRVVGTLAGTVLHARERKGKSGNAYAFVAFSDPTGQFEAVVFSEALAASRALLEPGTAVLIDVEAEADGETVKVRVQRLASLEKAAEARHAGMKIYVEDTRALAALAEQVGGEGGQGAVPARASPGRSLQGSRVRAAAGHRRHPQAAERAEAGRGSRRDQRALGPLEPQLLLALALAKPDAPPYKPPISHAGC